MKYFIKLCFIIILMFSLFMGGCSGTGFNKRTTFIPDSMTVAGYQARYREEDAAYRGATLSFTWNFK